MKIKVVLALVFLSLLFVNIAFSEVNIHFPPNKTLLDDPVLTVSGYSYEKISKELTITVEGTEGLKSKSRKKKIKTDSNSIFSVEVNLFPGMNRLVLGDRSVNVFYNDGSGDVPYAFSYMYRHSEPECDNCHKTDPLFSEELIEDEEELCSECHDMVSGQENIHPGFEDNSCVDCHDPHFSKTRGHLAKKMPDLCYGCHESVTEMEGEALTIVHPPVEQGECARCHNPHASNNEFLLYKEKYELCATCHPEPKEYGHGDEYDDCSMCHEHHRAKRFLLLKDEYWENCLDCHDEVAEQKFKHLPKGRGCGDCHDPHSDDDLDNVKRGCKKCHKNKDSDFDQFHGGLVLPVEKCLICHKPHDAYNNRLLRSKLHFPLTQAGNCVACHEMTVGKDKKKRLGWKIERSAVCFKCHSDKRPLVGYDRSIHPPVLNGECVQCHSPHLKINTSQLLLPVEKICFKCHESFNEKFKKIKDGSIHPPAEEDDCLMCHDPHKSENLALLLYTGNDLCFECHDESSAKIEGKEVKYYHEPPTDDFCINCHEAHISENKNLLREVLLTK